MAPAAQGAVAAQSKRAGVQHTPGPWPITQTGDGKRYVIGDGLVEGPNGYEVAEVYSDDCDQQEALANARLIAAAPELLDLLRRATTMLEEAQEGLCGSDSVCVTDDCEDAIHPLLDEMRAALARAAGEVAS